MNWTLEESINIIRRYLQLDDTDTTLDSVIMSVLAASRSIATPPAVGTYRPFISAAAVSQTILLRGGIIEADNVVWESTDKIIEGLLAIQKSFDTSLGLQIPPGWTVEDFRLNMTTQRKPILSAMIAI